MSDFVLPIFPEGSLGSSVVTTTWVGVFVIAFFSLRFGWVLSGLVVPGYLVPLLIVKPWAAVVVFAEGVVTYFLVWLYSERLSGHATWSSLFGRDRFFALVLCSVVVRLTFDAWLLPALGAFLDDALGIEFDYRNNLHSFGLIVVSLLANQFWKPGFVRGLGPVLATIGITYLIVRYGLMEFTNFRISNLAYLYEEIASSILATPKAYIILLTTAFLASRMNLRYGWDFNGILIPALIALQWYQPLKIVATFVEAFVIYGLAVLLLRTPLFANTTIEGGRKLLLFFNISFAYKMALGYSIEWLAPGVKVTDYFGFGYLLSTLIAIKMHDKDILARLTRATLQISLTGVVLGSLVGFLLSYVPTPGLWWSVPEAQGGTAAAVPAAAPGTTVSEAVRRAKVDLYPVLYADDLALPVPWEIEAFEAAVGRLRAYAEEGDAAEFWRAQGLLEQIGYRAEFVEGRYLVLRDASRRGWGLFVIDVRAESALVVEVPDPLDARGLVEAALTLFKTTGARALAVAGTTAEAAARGGQGGEIFARYRALLPAFRRALRDDGVLQVREHTARSLRLAAAGEAGDGDAPPGALWVAGGLPAGLDLATLEWLLGTLRVEFGRPPLAGTEAGPRSGFAALFLAREGVRTLALTGRAPPFVEHAEGDLRAGLAAAARAAESESGTKLYEAPSLDELLFFDREVLTPLLRTIADGYDAAAGSWTDAGLRELGLVALAAEALDHELIRYTDRPGGEEFLVLVEREGDDLVRTSWGVHVFRVGSAGAADYVVQVPRALPEPETLAYGPALFDWLDARALLISAQPDTAPADHLADPLRPGNARTLFNLASQVLVREAGDEPLMLVQSRTLDPGGRPTLPEGDALVAFGDASAGPLGERLVDTLQTAGLTLRIVDGGPGTLGYEAGRPPQARYLEQSANKSFAAVWFSPLAPRPYAERMEVRLE